MEYTFYDGLTDNVCRYSELCSFSEPLEVRKNASYVCQTINGFIDCLVFQFIKNLLLSNFSSLPSFFVQCF